MNNLQLEILKVAQAMFNAAPGARFLNIFTAFINNTNGSTKQLANALAKTKVFEQLMYSDTLTNNEFSIQLVENIVGTLVSAENKAWVVSAIETMLTEGQSRGEVIHKAAMALASVNSSHTDWGGAALQFKNKVDVAYYYSIDKNGPATDLSVLQRVTDSVTNLADTVNDAKLILDSDVSGKVIDGYIRDAAIFADLNGDGVLNEDEVSTITDEYGNYSLVGIEAFGNLIAVGGSDIATGRLFEGSLSAPAGSSVVTPLTTLIYQIVQNSTLSVSHASAIVLRTLSLNQNIDLINFDPIKESVRSDTDAITTDIALAAQAAADQVNILVGLTAALLNGAGITANEDIAINLVYKVLAASIVSENTQKSFDLASKADITQVIQSSIVETIIDDTQLTQVGLLLADVSRAIANLNNAVADVLTNRTDAILALNKLTAIQIVAENIEIDIETIASTGDLKSVLAKTEGVNLTRAVEVARTVVGDVDGNGSSDATKNFNFGNFGTFVVTEANGILTFGGSASGNITIEWTGAAGNSVAMFIRGGVIATTTVDFAGSTKKITLASGQTLAGTAANFSGLTFDGAGNVILTGESTVFELVAIDYSAVTGSVTYSINDFSMAIVGAPAVVLNMATNITVVDPVTISQAATIENATNSGINVYDITDTAANLAASSNADLALAGTVTSSDTATVAQAEIIAGFTKAVVYSVVDVAANIAAGAGLSEAVNITITDDVTIAQATTIENATNSGSKSVATITDTASAIAASSDAVLANAAGAVTASTAATIAQAGAIDAFATAVVFA
ncbi:hypothetical protein C8R11_11361, partial [Nitrosomonas aestuarii]